MAWRRKMRRISALSAYRFDRIERPQQALNVFGLAEWTRSRSKVVIGAP